MYGEQCHNNLDLLEGELARYGYEVLNFESPKFRADLLYRIHRF